MVAGIISFSKAVGANGPADVRVPEACLPKLGEPGAPIGSTMFGFAHELELE